ncbi:hypothetical protein ACWIFB_01395 [Dietzia sp. NPDC055340]
MTGFWDSGDVSAAERRQRRMEEARRRVESGENSPPPPPAAPAAATRSRTTRAPRAATVDPVSVADAQYAVWRSVQHFCLSDSLPDASGKNLDLLIAWSDSIQPFRLRPRIVARLDGDGAWLPVCYAKDGSRDPITQAQAERYRDARVEGAGLSGGAQKPLKETDHPESTVTL